jgi:ribosome-binding factor A
MPLEYSRGQRVADQIQRQLAQLIQQEVRDPRIGMVTLTAVEINRELDHAHIYVTVLGDQNDIDLALTGLKQASGYLRSKLASRLKLRTTPQLRFVFDKSLQEGNRLTALIDSTK